MDARYVNYKGKFKTKRPKCAENCKAYQFEPGISGNPRMRESQIEKAKAKRDRGEELTSTEKKLLNLKPRPFVKGQVANPKGRPIGSPSIVESLKVYLRRHPEKIEKIVLSLIGMSTERNMNQLAAITQVMDRLDGKPTEHRVIEGTLPIRLEFIPAPERLPEARFDESNIIEGQVIEPALIEENTGG